MRSLTAVVVAVVLFAFCVDGYQYVSAASASAGSTLQESEGKVSSAEILAGPFDLHRKYGSMQGPYVIQKFRLSDLLASRRVIIPESMITFVEGGASPSMSPSMSGSTASRAQSAGLIGLVDTHRQKRELYWLKGLKIQVIDEKGKLLPTAEFICHVNVDVDRAFRQKLFPHSEGSGNARIMTLTQGQTAFYFPPGFAVPVASDEVWTFTLQAANRTTSKHRRLKELLTIDLIKDSQLSKPVKALAWFNPYITVVVDAEHPKVKAEGHGNMPDCLGMTSGNNAPNMAPGSSFKDRQGRELSGHWVVPPGTHVYRQPIADERDPGFAAKDRKIHAVWSHVHPLCTNSCLIECDAEAHRKVFSAEVTTKTAHGLEIERIENIVSKAGIPLKGGRHYQLEATYKNDSGEPQDSMVALGVFFEDEGFSRPDWKHTAAAPSSSASPESSSGELLFCGVRHMSDSGSVHAKSPPETAYPLFDVNVDGPLLTSSRKVEVITSAGMIHLILNPASAPENASQIYRLLTHGVFNGTPIFRYEPNFVLQTAVAETKVEGQPLLSYDLRGLLRRLPLEISPLVRHKKWALTMAHGDSSDSAVSSFSILLADAPHLDGKYTVFGELIPDSETLATVARIIQKWSLEKPWIKSAHVMDSGATIPR